LLRNPPNLAGGQDLVSFYLTPSYRLWDPSTIVFCSFALFFAMILADAGYGLVLGLGLILGWRRMGHSAAGQRLRILFAVLVSATVVWGVLTGSYFGVTPVEGTLLAKFHLFDLFDSKTMMRLSIMIGVAHLVLANVADAWRRGLSPSALAPIGWVAMLLGALAVGLSKTEVGPATLATAGAWAFGLGGVAVVLFTGGQGTIGARLVQGLLALARIPSAFGDVLSYLRLFALGLASASLALAFNDLSAQVAAAGPGVRRLFALLILLIGHGLNFTLGLMSGVVHGLRLNFIEFFNWSIAEEGYPFQAFARKETTPWNKP
jgi:V/A-type H+-transporting ATPase subunit I